MPLEEKEGPGGVASSTTTPANEASTDSDHEKSSLSPGAAASDWKPTREFLLAIRDWDKLIRQSYEHLKPGGYLELSCSVPDPCCDDNTVPEDSAWVQFTQVFFEIGEALGASGQAPKTWKAKMEAQGFEEVHEYIFKIPCNAWPRDKRFKSIGTLEVS